MGISSSISRLTGYYRRHGFWGTIRRFRLSLKRELFSNRMVLFYCDLAEQTKAPAKIPTSLELERLRSYAELSPQDLREMTSFWNPKQAHRNIRKRFKQGASLWLIKSGEKLAGYGWTLQGRTIEPYYFPLGLEDVHLFDFHVFPEYRGQGLNPFLVTHILSNLARIGRGRAFIEAAEWNEAQLSSLRKTPFRPLGRFKSLTMFGHTFVYWVESKTAQQMRENTKRSDVPVIVGRPHQQ
jgi:ribosomal protein S18 acetylase RimI-like enzyme